jgi:RhoGAP domain
MRSAIMKLPSSNLQVLKRVMEHLTIGSTHEDQTRMAEKQFSLVFGQTILTPPEQGGIKAINAGIQYGNRVVEVMLIHVSHFSISKPAPTKTCSSVSCYL